MKAFNWDIGDVPDDWKDAVSVRVMNGDFRGGIRAAVEPIFDISPWTSFDAQHINYRMFYEHEAEKVKAWIDWFMKEYDE